VFVEGENKEQVEYLENFAKVTTVEDYEAMEERISRRDDYLGIYNEGGEYIVVYQGNEGQELVDYAKLLLVFEQEEVDYSNPNATIHSFERSTHPMKLLFVNILLLMIGVMGGMLIGINIVEEKVDRTIRAIHLSPVSRMGFVLGKSMMGIFLPIYGTIALVYLTGFTQANIFQVLVLSLIGSVIGILVGFLEGTKNTDAMEVAASIKMLFMPVFACMAAIEFLSDKWQWLFMWIPWYWVYKGNHAVLTYEATWGQIGLYSLFIAIPSVLVFLYLRSGIKKGLE
jgi:ABC-type Na+ efflux pump permease subunit